MAWYPWRRRTNHPPKRRFPHGKRRRDHHRRAGQMVRPHLGPTRLRLRPKRQGLVPNGRLQRRLAKLPRNRRRPPATVVEMTLGSSSSPLHFYDVSLVDGFNLPVSMKPIGGGVGCGVAACEVDLNVCCPSALEVKRDGRVVGCKSACLAMQSAKHCCTGEYANPKACKPTLFANLFKAICPKAYSYAFDDSSSLNKCRASRYVITFCPPK